MKQLRAKQLAAAGGIVSTLVDCGVLAIATKLHIAVAMATVLGVLAGAAVGFAWNKRVAFANRNPVTVSQLATFALVVGVTAVLMAAGMQIASVWFGLPFLLAKLICAAAVFAVWTFPAQRKLVFA